MSLNIQAANIQSLKSLTNKSLVIDVLRLDAVHPIVSGNKWFKLRYYLQEAVATNHNEIASFGGAYSNHIIATACACYETGLKSIGFIRGDANTPLSPTLKAAVEYGMQLEFISREAYRNKMIIQQNNDKPGRYWIAEGGYGIIGAKGAASILENIDITKYTHLLCSVGSGTMAAGLLNACTPGQQLIGISSQKNNTGLEQQVLDLVSEEKRMNFTLLHDYHFGGYAKHPKELIDFIRDFWYRESIPTDIVYTGKLFFAMEDLISKNYFPENSELLVIHSGGLQGNQSLDQGVLPF